MAYIFFFDAGYMLVALIGVGISLLATGLVKASYAKYSRIGTVRGYSGAETARAILAQNDIHDVRVEQVGGFLSDHYDPTKKVLRLSPDNFHGSSIAAVGVAAHEAGHAIQHARSFAPMAIRSLLVPVANIGSQFGLYAAIFGLYMNWLGLVKIGIVLFSGLLLFQMVTLPVELDASRRAKKALAESGITADSRELSGVASVLRAAALTYVASVAATALTLLYFLFRAGMLGGGSRD